MKNALCVSKFIIVTIVGLACLSVLHLNGPGAAFAIQVGDDTQTTQPQPAVPITGEIAPDVPGREERPVAPSQVDSRAIMEQPRQVQKRWADSYLPQSVRNVTDPQDGLRKDDRVAVLEGINSQIVYTFHSNNKVINLPNQPDLPFTPATKADLTAPITSLWQISENRPGRKSGQR